MTKQHQYPSGGLDTVDYLEQKPRANPIVATEPLSFRVPVALPDQYGKFQQEAYFCTFDQVNAGETLLLLDGSTMVHHAYTAIPAGFCLVVVPKKRKYWKVSAFPHCTGMLSTDGLRSRLHGLGYQVEECEE